MLLKNIPFLLVAFLLCTDQLAHAEQKLYWTDSTYASPAIHCVDSQGKSCVDTANPANTVLLSLTPMTDYPTGIVIDEKNNKLIFTTGSNIETCNLDGTGRTAIVSDLNTATHLGIDPIGSKIYWTSFDGIQSANLNGSGQTTLPVTPAVSFSGLTVDATNSKLIWFEGALNSNKLLNISDLTILTPTTLGTITQNENLFGLTVNETTSRPYYIEYDQNTYMFSYIKYYDGYSTGGSITTHLAGLTTTNTAETVGYHGSTIDFPEANIYYGNSYAKAIYRSSLNSASATQQLFVSNAGEVNGMVFSCGKHAPDTDGDKTADCREDCPTDPLKTIAGECGCNTSDIDSDDDGTPDCLDQCKDDDEKTVPGLCGCGEEEPGVCGCGLIEDINTDGKVVCVKTRQLAPNTRIEEPPIVEVEDNDVTIILEKFTKPTLTLKKKKNKKNNVTSTSFDYYDYSVETKAKGLKIRYEIQLSKEGGAKKDIERINSKKNEYTKQNLPPGNYNVIYRPIIVGPDGKDVAKIKFSPPASFTIN